MKKMKLVESIDEIRQAITQIKENGTEWFTNLYVEDGKLEKWIEKQQMFIEMNPTDFFLVRKREGFWHMYFAVTDIGKFERNLHGILRQCDGKIIVDLLGDIELLKGLLCAHGFKKYMSLTRMMKFCTDNQKSNKVPGTAYAILGEEQQISDILYENMDPLCEQIPDLDEIQVGIEQKNILVVRHENFVHGEIEAFLWWERYGITSQWRYWASRKKYRYTGAGLKLYPLYFSATAGVKRHVIWVRDDNPISKLQQYYGFKFDRLKDEVVVLDRGHSSENN